MSGITQVVILVAAEPKGTAQRFIRVVYSTVIFYAFGTSGRLSPRAPLSSMKHRVIFTLKVVKGVFGTPVT